MTKPIHYLVLGVGKTHLFRNTYLCGQITILTIFHDNYQKTVFIERVFVSYHIRAIKLPQQIRFNLSCLFILMMMLPLLCLNFLGYKELFIYIVLDGNEPGFSESSFADAFFLIEQLSISLRLYGLDHLIEFSQANRACFVTFLLLCLFEANDTKNVHALGLIEFIHPLIVTNWTLNLLL